MVAQRDTAHPFMSSDLIHVPSISSPSCSNATVAAIRHAKWVPARTTQGTPSAGAAGWYQDPGGDAELRLWDGERWTAETTATPVDISAWPSEADRSDDAINGPNLVDVRGTQRASRILAMVVVAFLFLGVYEVVHGISGGTTNANAFSPALGIATAVPTAGGSTVGPPDSLPTPRAGDSGDPHTAELTPAAGPPDCSSAGRDAGLAIDWLAARGLPISAVPAQPSLGSPKPAQAAPSPPSGAPADSAALGAPDDPVAPGSPCSHATFTDSRGGSTNQIWGFANGTDAHRAVHSDVTEPDLIFVDGQYVIRLVPALRQMRAQYVDALGALIDAQGCAGECSRPPRTMAQSPAASPEPGRP